MSVTGRAWVLGDDIDTDAMAPGAYMKSPIEVLARHCLETVEPRLAVELRPGDVIVAGLNFGIGSSREQAAQALKHLGVAAVFAGSYGGIFHRNAINLGLPVLVSDAAKEVRPGDMVALDLKGASAQNLTQERPIRFDPLPPFLLELVEDGGLMAHLEKRFAKERTP